MRHRHLGNRLYTFDTEIQNKEQQSQGSGKHNLRKARS